MNILIIHEIDWVNKVIFEPHHFAELLSKKKHNVFVIDCPDTHNKKFFSGLKTRIIKDYSRVYSNSKITLIRPPSILIKGLNRISYFFTCKKIIKKTILENKIDVVLLYGSITNGIQTIDISRELKIPVVYRLLDISHGLVQIPIVKNLAKKYESTVLTNAHKVLTTTHDLSRYAIEMGSKKNNTQMFPLGINREDFFPMEKDYAFAKSLGISSLDDIIVFIGTIYPFAGLLELVSNFPKILKENPNTKLLIVGGGPSFVALQNLVLKMALTSKIILTNFKPQNELSKFISLADICINPFQINYVTNRILPTKILEYFACSKPVLSTPLSGTKELLPNEDFGIVYSSPENFVDNLLVLLRDKNKLKQLGELGHSYVKDNHDWDVLSDILIKELENISKTHS